MTSKGSATGQGADLASRHKGLGRRTGLISAFTLLSRIVGYAREVVSAALFGDSSGIFDAFLTAWRVPNLFRRLFGEGAIATSFQTSFSEVEGRQGEAAGRLFFWRVMRLLAVIITFITVAVVALVLVMPDRMPWTGWRWLGADPGPVRELTIRVSPFMLAICLTAVASAALHVRGRFAAVASAPVVFNLVWIATLSLIGARFGWGVPEADKDTHLQMASWLAWGVILAGIVQLFVIYPSLRAVGLVGQPSQVIHQAEVGGVPKASFVLIRALPLAVGAAVYQVNVMVDGFMAEALLSDGGPTTHYYATRIQQLPVALVAMAATRAVFPALKMHGQNGDLGALSRLHLKTQRNVAFFALPSTAGLLALGYPIVMLSFMRGGFDREGVERTGDALMMLSLSILPVGASGLAVRCFYSLNEFKLPVLISSVLMLLNLVLNYWFVAHLQLDVKGLALGTAITSWLGLGILPLLAKRLRGHQDMRELWRSVSASTVGAVACGLVAHFAYRAIPGPLQGALTSLGLVGAEDTFVARLSALLLAIPIGAVAHFFVSAALGSEEAQAFLRKIRRR